MKGPILGANDLRALKLGAAIVIPILLLRLGLLPFGAAWLQRQTQLEAERSLYTRELAVVAEMDTNTAARASTAGQVAVGYRRVFTSDEPNLAAAGALGYVDSLARANRVVVDRIVPERTASQSANLTALLIDLSASSDFEGIVTFLREMEAGPVLVRIPSISIEAGDTGGDETSAAQSLQFKATLKMFFAPENTRQAELEL